MFFHGSHFKSWPWTSTRHLGLSVILYAVIHYFPSPICSPSLLDKFTSSFCWTFSCSYPIFILTWWPFLIFIWENQSNWNFHKLFPHLFIYCIYTIWFVFSPVTIDELSVLLKPFPPLKPFHPISFLLSRDIAPALFTFPKEVSFFFFWIFSLVYKHEILFPF